jgi:hypothetical protein
MLRLAAFLLALFPLVAPAASLTITPEDWAQLRESPAPAPVLGELLAALERNRNGVVLVRHPSGDQGARWAEAVRDFLVARGLPSARIVFLPAPFKVEQLELEVRAAGAVN